MPNTIANSTEEVESCVAAITSSKAEFKLENVSITACDGISADSDCTDVYSRAVNASVSYQEVLGGLSLNMESINGTLVDADNKVATNS